MRSLVKQQITSQPDGRISYEQYMETVLYHPKNGYYRKPTSQPGKSGDYFTSPNVHPVFAEVMARFFIDLIEKEGLSPVVCEVGGGDGGFAEAVLKEWRRLRPHSYQELRYIIVEGNAYFREAQTKRFPNDQMVEKYADLRQLQHDSPSFCGIVFSNELLDAFPVRVVQSLDGELNEIKVTEDEKGELAETAVPCHDERISNWINRYGFKLHEGQRIEVPLQMTTWLQEIGQWLKHGALLTVDYGYTKEEWQASSRRDGSLRGYFRHQLINDPLLYPGQMDLTTHIHLDAVEDIAKEQGFAHEFTMAQREFLLAAGILEDLSEHDESDPFSTQHRKNRAIHSLISAASMGGAFHVLLEGKGLSASFSRELLRADPFKKAIEKRR